MELVIGSFIIQALHVVPIPMQVASRRLRDGYKLQSLVIYVYLVYHSTVPDFFSTVFCATISILYSGSLSIPSDPYQSLLVNTHND